MIRWYDWFFAIMISNLIMANITLALIGPTVWFQCMGLIGAYLMYDMWLDAYCKFRLKMEIKNG